MSHENGYFKKIIGRPEIVISPRPQIHLISRGVLPNLQRQWNAGDNPEEQILGNDVLAKNHIEAYHEELPETSNDTGLKPAMGYVVSDNIILPKYNPMHESGNKEKHMEPKKNEEKTKKPGKPRVETLYSDKILIGADLKNIVPEDVLIVKSKEREGYQEPKKNEEITEQPGKPRVETFYSGKILIRPDLKNIVPEGTHNIVKKIVQVKKEAKKKVEIKNTSAKDLTSLSPTDTLIHKTPGIALHGKRNDEPSLVIKKIDIHIVNSRGAHSEKAKSVDESRTDILTRSYLWRFDPG